MLNDDTDADDSASLTVTQIKKSGGDNSAVSAAMANATDAYNLATEARQMASDASYAASQAQSTADAALECCNQNSQKLDRMFEKAMMK